jgi:hypothetical protein
MPRQETATQLRRFELYEDAGYYNDTMTGCMGNASQKPLERIRR